MKSHWKTLAPAGAVAMVLLFAPFWREEVDAPFVIEPSERAVVRAETSGLVRDVYVNEGDEVRAGAPLAGLRDVETESAAASASSGLRQADARATDAQLRYADYGSAAPEQRRWSGQVQRTAERQRRLSLAAPIAGTVVTPHARDLRGTFVAEGTTVVEIQNLKRVRARTFIPEPDMRVLTQITGNSLHVDGSVWPLRGTLVSISPTPQPIEPGLVPENKYKGIQPPPQYVATLLIDNPDGRLRAGMNGDAKIFGERRSVAGMVWRTVADFAGRKIW